MYRILIADDEGLMLEGFKGVILAEFGEKCIVETAKTGRVVIEKAETFHPDIVFMDEPTRGVDVGAKYEIYQLMQSLAKEGKAVVMISSEMPELLGVCDRILVLKEGRILGQVKTKETSQEQIMAMIVNG